MEERGDVNSTETDTSTTNTLMTFPIQISKFVTQTWMYILVFAGVGIALSV
jgi:hypothetical protein